MKPEQKVALTVGGTFGLLGAGLLAVVGSPVAWAALAYGTYKVSKAAYQGAKHDAKIQASKEDPDSSTDWFL
jgi:hypothetical protein